MQFSFAGRDCFKNDVPDDGVPRRALFCQHGFTGSGDGFQTNLGLDDYIAAKFHTFYPNAPIDPATNKRRWLQPGNFDTLWMLGLVNHCKDMFDIDMEHVYLFGHSNGGMVSYQLSNDAPEFFKGVYCAATTIVAESTRYDRTVHHVHGKKDTLLPFNGNAQYGSYADTRNKLETAGARHCMIELSETAHSIDEIKNGMRDEHGTPLLESIENFVMKN